VTSPTRLAVSVVSVCALAVPLAGCGAKDGSTASGAHQTTTANGQIKQVGATDDTVGAFVDRVRAGLGDSGTVHVQVTATGATAASAAGDVSYGPDGPEVRITASAPMLGQGKATFIVVGQAAFVSVPGFTEPGKYLKIDKHSLGSMGPMAGHPDLSPEDMFAAVRAAIVGVDDLGSADVAGTPTTHYRLQLDPAKAMKSLGDQLRGMPMSPDQLGKIGKVDVDFWLDGSDRIRRVQTELQGTTVDVELSAWGEPVAIQAPPAADVVQAPPGPMIMGGQGSS
jgi:hypothetical protein